MINLCKEKSIVFLLAILVLTSGIIAEETIVEEEINTPSTQEEIIGVEKVEVEDERTSIEKKTDTNRNLLKQESNAILQKFYKEKTGNKDSSTWNTKDYQGHFNNNGTGVGMIGNLKTFMGDNEAFQRGMNADPNASNTNNIMQDDTIENPSIKAWSTDLQDGLIANTTSVGSKNQVAINNTVKCYITRDIPMRFKCNKTGIMYGGGVDEDGLRAKTECESECFEQFNCVAVKEEAIESEEVINNIQATYRSKKDENEQLNKNVINKKFIHKLLETKRVKEIELKVSSTKTTTAAKLTLKVVTWKNENVTILDRFNTLNLSSKQKIRVNDNIKEIYIEISNLDFEEVLTVEDIKIIFNKDNRFICPKHQDIKNSTGDNFSHLCPSGNVVEFNVFESSYKICSDYGIRGDNTDGTYSTLDECNSICKVEYGCKLNTSFFSTDILKNFREGCIQGEANCEPDTCKKLRLSGAKVLNENIFDANSKLTKTVVNSVQVQGVDRPRFLLSEDVEFEERNKQEWKDEAYRNMVERETFRITQNKLNEDTEEDSAYSLGLNTLDTIDGYETVPIRGLYWNYKPKSSDVNIGNRFKFYIILEVIAERYIFNQNGQKEKTKDKILYVKTNESDNFKPFAIKENYAKNVFVKSDLDDILEYSKQENEESTWNKKEEVSDDEDAETSTWGTKDSDSTDDDEDDSILDYKTAENETAVWKYKSFNKTTNKWYSHSSSMNLESYKIHNMELDKPFIREEAISNLANLVYALPGLIRSATKVGPVETLKYTGQFQGNGHGVGKYSVYAFNGRNETITYSEIIEKIDNKEIKPIFDNIQRGTYKQTLKDDTGSIETDTDVFTYGTSDKKTAFVRMKPKKEDVGKKAFIFIFAY